jgi:hypothetical protein
MFNHRWRREFGSINRQAVNINCALTIPKDSPGGTNSEDDRASVLASLSKTLILRSIDRETTFNMVKSTLESLLLTVSKSEELLQATQTENHIDVRNPLKVRTKGRPKTGCKRYKSQAEKTQKKRKG